MTYDTQGGSQMGSLTDVSGALVYLNTPNRTQYNFNGWFTQSSGGTQVTSPYVLAGNITVYARWTPRFYVFFNTQGGYLLDDIMQDSGTQISLPTPTYLYDAAIFNYWATDPNGGGTSYVGGEQYTITGNITLYAQWLFS